MDGVIVAPPLGINLSISRRLHIAPLTPEETARAQPAAQPQLAGSGPFWRWVNRLRYAGRRPLPGVREALAALAQRRELHIVSARSAANRPDVERWLAEHGLAEYIAAVHLNAANLAPPRFKLAVLANLGIAEHVDDDGATAYYLAMQGRVRVYLCDWPRNRGLPYPDEVRRVASLHEVARLLT